MIADLNPDRANWKLACPAEPGSGPEHETCGGCRCSHTISSMSKNVVSFCTRMHWDPGTSFHPIDLSWPACAEFQDQAGFGDLLRAFFRERGIKPDSNGRYNFSRCRVWVHRHEVVIARGQFQRNPNFDRFSNENEAIAWLRTRLR